MHTITVLAGLSLISGAIAALYKSFSRYPVDVIGVFLGFFFLVFVVRAGAVHLGDLRPSPAFLPDFRGETDIFIISSMLVLLMLTGTFVGAES